MNFLKSSSFILHNLLYLVFMMMMYVCWDVKAKLEVGAGDNGSVVYEPILLLLFWIFSETKSRRFFPEAKSDICDMKLIKSQ